MSKKTFNPHSPKNQKDRKRRCKRVYVPTANYAHPYWGIGNRNAKKEPKADSVGVDKREQIERVKKENSPKKTGFLTKVKSLFTGRKKT